MTERYELSRRKTLAGLATIGAAGAGAGLGTSALFSDEESFEGNIVEAGTLDMTVTAEVAAHVDNDYWNSLELEGSVTADGEPEVFIQVDDVKPGDWAIVCFNVSIGENPGYVTIHAENFNDEENGHTEPEGEVDQDDDGELDEKLLLTYWDNYDDSGDRSGLSSLDNITNAASNQRYSGNWQPSDEDGVVSGQSEPEVEYTNVREFYYGRDGDETSIPPDNDPLGAGFASGDGILVGGVSNTTVVGDPSVADQYPRVNEDGELVFYLLFDLHQDVGNEVQGDSVSFDLRFNTEQVRNNDDARSGRWDGYTGA